MILSTPVVTAVEMSRLERVAIERGSDSKLFMEQAGSKIAELAKTMLEQIGAKRVVLLVGKGNKGGDSYVAGIRLMEMGFQVRACPLFAASECSELNQFFAKLFKGQVDVSFDFSAEDLIVDGLLGTGFKGQVDGTLRLVMEIVNQSQKPVLSIDLPSGLNGTTGEVGGVAIHATHTGTLGFAKTGLFVRDGWRYTGTVSVEDFGLPEDLSSQVNADFLLPTVESLELPPMERTHHKYERGFVAGFGGSSLFRGALKLSGRGAIHSGTGIVKLFSSEDIGAVEDELLCQVWDLKAWTGALEKAQAVFVGPGLGRSEGAKKMLFSVLETIHQPCVLDADALFFLRERLALPKRCILTPHRGEMLHLLGESDLTQEELLKRCAEFAEEKGCVLVLKGAPTFIFSPGSKPYVLVRGDPGMATAGSGDVLTGIISSMLAQGKEPLEAAVLGVTLHGLAGEIAAARKTSYGYTAVDLIESFPEVFSFFI